MSRDTAAQKVQGACADRHACERDMERRISAVEAAVAILPGMAQDVRDMRNYLLEGP